MPISTIGSAGINQAADTTLCTTSGNVGIGTASPSQKLTVAGAVSVLSGNKLYMWDASNAYTPYLMGTTTPLGGMGFFTNSGSQAMTLDSSGNLLVGTTTATSGYLFKVNGTIHAAGGNAHALVYASNEFNVAGNNVGSDFYFNYRGSAAAISTYRFINGQGAGTYSACVATAFTPSSDYRIKSDVQNVGTVLDKVCALRPVNYLKEGLEGREYGLIAHEAHEQFPDIVRGDKDAVDEDGDMVIQTVNYMALTAILTKAIQELKTELDSVKAELAALKGTA